MKPLIILEMANNHSGSLEHGKKIIQAFGEICRPFFDRYEFVFKFQYRNLDTFIRKDMAGNLEIPLIKRFSETRLNPDDFLELVKECRHHSFGTMATPFDESSVSLILSHNLDYIKIASCSFGDWPLLEEIAISGKPVVASCAGSSDEIVDQVVAFFRNRNIPLILQHCVGNYPTSPDDMNVGQVAYLRNKYPFLQIGFSSHEDPATVDIAPLALALGARSFEKHVALETESIKKNKYSVSPDEFSFWLRSLDRASSILGSKDNRYTSHDSEISSLRKLQRGVFIKSDIPPGRVITNEDIYYAFPPSEDQLTANDISKYTELVSLSELQRDKPILKCDVQLTNNRSMIYEIALKVSSLVKEAKIAFPSFADLEISHHYGLKSFAKFGLTLITVVNREYCKKILILLPGQSHPEQFHKQKEETFHVLWGSGVLRLDGIDQDMNPGDVFVIQPGIRHFFTSQHGIILEEISTTHYLDDSFYTDEAINLNTNRKTFLTHWRIS